MFRVRKIGLFVLPVTKPVAQKDIMGFRSPITKNIWHMRTRNLNKLAFVYSLLLIGTTSAWAQCGCTFTIPAGAGIYTFDGAVKGAKPGDVICLARDNTNVSYFRTFRAIPTILLK